MPRLMSACGVWCSDCPAYRAADRGIAYQRRVAAAWARIYGLSELPENIDCGGCLGGDADVFHTCRGCAARRCCLSSGFDSCAECPERSCLDLEHAQAVWKGVAALKATLSRADFDTYARPYCGHRQRIASARRRL